MRSFNQFEIRIEKELTEKPGLHSEVELLFVVEGKAKVTLQDIAYEMKREDVLVVNSSVNHSVTTEPGSIICSVLFDYQVLVHILKKPNSIFICNSAADPSPVYGDLRNIIWELIREEVKDVKKTDSMKYSILFRILDVLIENFLADDTNPEISENYDADEKLQAIIHYVHQNYQDGISLSELAAEMYTSTSTLSRLFKKQTGTYFADYVNQVRIHYAVNELIYTEKNMTKIAMDCGFSNASAFTKIFREVYDMAPTEYRQKMKHEVQAGQEMELSVKEVLSGELRPEETEVKNVCENRAVQLDMREAKPYSMNFTEVVNGGFMHTLQQANVQFHLLNLAENLHFKYVRIWNVFDVKLRMSDGETMGNYNFDEAMNVLEFLVQNHLRPWLDFTNRPDTIVRDDGDNLKFESVRIPFKSRAIWEDMFKNFMKTLVRRFGQNEVDTWVFELGREVFHESYNGFYENGDADLADNYAFVHETVHRYAPNAGTGFSVGPTNIGERQMVELFSSMKEKNAAPQFVSCVLFPYLPSPEEKGTEEQGSYVRSTDRDYEVTETRRLKEILTSAGIPDTKIYVAEWNFTVSTRNLLNDSCFRSALFCKKIADLWDLVENVGIWLASDWICSSFDSGGIVHGGSGILTKDGIRKPICLALSFLQHLGREVIGVGENYIATRMGQDEYQILLFNPAKFSSGAFLKSEKQMDPKALDLLFESLEKKTVVLQMNGFGENSAYYVKKRTIDKEHGSVLDKWAEFGYDHHLERTDVKYLRDLCVPGLTMAQVTTQGDRMMLSVDLEPQETSIIHIFPVD